jgi:hypothetical protein
LLRVSSDSRFTPLLRGAADETESAGMGDCQKVMTGFGHAKKSAARSGCR